VETDDLRPLIDGASGQLTDAGEIVCFVVIAALELRRGDAYISYGNDILSYRRPGWLVQTTA